MALTECPIKNCFAPDLPCQEGKPDLAKCPHFKKSAGGALPPEAIGVSHRLTWSGNSMGAVDVGTVAARSRPSLIGLIGAHDAGKTTLLTALYLLLTRGHQPPNYRFAGSNTLGGWETLAYTMRRLPNSGPTFPPHTPANAGRVPGMLHLALRENGEKRRDVLLTDAPGEWFERWAVEKTSPQAEGASWMAEHASAFALFADCQALSGPMRGDARSKLSLLADRLADEAEGRPVAVVWSKSDIAVRDTIRQSLREQFVQKFPHLREFETSITPAGGEEPAMAVLDILKWLLLPAPACAREAAPRLSPQDPFLSYRGHRERQTA